MLHINSHKLMESSQGSWRIYASLVVKELMWLGNSSNVRSEGTPVAHIQLFFFKNWSILFSVEAMGVLSIQLYYEVSFLESIWYLSTYLKGVSVLMCCPISSKECLFHGVILLEETNIAGFLVGFTVTKSFLSLEVHSFLNVLVPGKPMM